MFLLLKTKLTEFTVKDRATFSSSLKDTASSKPEKGIWFTWIYIFISSTTQNSFYSVTTMQDHTHFSLESQMNLIYMFYFGLWEEARVPRENPRRPKLTCKLHTGRLLLRFKVGTCFEATVLITRPSYFWVSLQQNVTLRMSRKLWFSFFTILWNLIF